MIAILLGTGAVLAGTIPTVVLDDGMEQVFASFDVFGPGFDPVLDEGHIEVRNGPAEAPTSVEFAPCESADSVRGFVQGTSSALVADIGGFFVTAEDSSQLVMDSASCCFEGSTAPVRGAVSEGLAGCFPRGNSFLAIDGAEVTVLGDIHTGTADDSSHVVIDLDPDATIEAAYTGTGRSSTELRNGSFGALSLDLLSSMIATGGSVGGDSLEMHQHAHLVIDGAEWSGLQQTIELHDDAVLEILSGPACGASPPTASILDTSFVFIAGSGFTIDDVPVAPGPVSALSGLVEGTLPSGDTVCFPFARDEGATVALPEPRARSAALVALLALLRLRRCTRRSS